MKKVFVLCQFGTPHEWTQQFIDHVQHLQKYGWYWKIFTPNPLVSKGNVEIIPMSAEQFNDLVEKKTGIRSNLFITTSGIPSVHITDFYVATGEIFEDWLTDADFWGITNIDVVYGRLDHYLPDSELADCDVFSDDINLINGVFSLYRNIPQINSLYKHIPFWKDAFSYKGCDACITGEGPHRIFATDEIGLSEVMKAASGVRYKYPQYYPFHSYDRLIQHRPEPNLEIKEDGTLVEVFKDPLMDAMPNHYLFKDKKNFGREIMYFHFLSTKKWPL